MKSLSAPSRITIVGAGIAGYTMATSLVAGGFNGEVHLVDREPGCYDRPPLSKDLFTPGFSLDSLQFSSPEELADRGITSHFGTEVSAIDPDRTSISFADGRELTSDLIVLATGGAARNLSIPGANDPDVVTLRTLADAERISSKLIPGRRAVIIGAGLIGAELASALVAAEVHTTLIAPAELPLQRAVGDQMAQYLHNMHHSHGVTVLPSVPRVIERHGDQLSVSVESGESFPADLVVVSVGISPATSLAQAAGLHVDDGVIVDQDYRTSHARVFCIGDAARVITDNTSGHRHEHWEAAKIAGEAAALAITGERTAPTGCSWFWSDRYGVHVEVAGRLSGPGDTIVRPALPHPAFFLLSGEHLVGAGTIDDSQSVRAARRIIDKQIPVSAQQLADPNQSLRAMLRGS